MRRLAAACLLAACLLAACKTQTGSLVEVDLKSATPLSVHRVHADVQLGTRSQDFELTFEPPTPTPTNFGIRFRPGDTGMVSVQVDVFDENEVQVASGMGAATIVVGEIVDLDIDLTPTVQPMPDLAIVPDLAAPSDLAAPPPDLVPTDWTAEASGTAKDLYAVFGAGSTVYACGADGILLQSTGNGTWISQVLSDPAVSPVPALRGLWVSAAGDAWAVGGNHVWHRDGNLWSSQTVGSSLDLAAILGDADSSGSGIVSLVVGGIEGHAALYAAPPGGTSWSKLTVPNGVGGTVTGLTLSGSGKIYGSVSSNGNLLVFDTVTGSLSATNQTFSQPVAATTSITSNANTTYAALGAAGGQLLVSAGDGAWSPYNTGAASQLWGVFAVPNTLEVYAVGNGGTIMHYAANGAWSPESVPVSSDLRAVWSNSSDAWAVGLGGTILHRHRP